MRLHGAMLFVKDLDGMTSFYSDVLGLQPVAETAGKLTFDVQDVDATMAKIEALGLPLLRRPWGGTEAVDPEGNVFAIRAGT